LINKVVTPRSLLAETRDLALEITDRSTKAVKLIKKAVNKKYSDASKKDRKEIWEVYRNTTKEPKW
jgi:enoyl-CoA hydratase